MVVGGIILGQVRFKDRQKDMIIETIGFCILQLGTYALTLMLIQVASKQLKYQN